MKSLDILFDELKKLNEKDNDYALKFEDILEDISSQGNSKIICRLMESLKDDAEYDELMFSIIHLIESYVDYIQEIIKCLPDLAERSLYWAMVIHIRILNNDSTLDFYRSFIPKLSAIERNALDKIINKIRDEYQDDFNDKIDYLLVK